jgi:hypothetical protein
MKKALLLFSIALGCYSTSRAQIVNIPDNNFKGYLLSHPLVNTNNDGEIQVSEAAAFSDTLFCASLNISDVTGLEAFTNMRGLDLYDNQLTSLNISANQALGAMNCSRNQLSSLDLSQNAAMEYLMCDSNMLTSIDVSNLPLLKALLIDGNMISSLDISNNPLLFALNCSNNQLTSLDVSANPLMQDLWLRNNQISSLDLSNNPVLNQLVCSSNQLSSLDVSNNPQLNWLLCEHNQLTAIDVSQNPNLEYLWCDDNQISVIDVSQNGILRNFGIATNPITELDISNNPLMEGFNCSETNISSLTIVNNPLVSSHVWCFSTPNLEYLNLANGNNVNTGMILAYNTPKLKCVTVDNVNFSRNFWQGTNQNFRFDEGVEFSEDCTVSLLDIMANKVNIALFPNPSAGVFNLRCSLHSYRIAVYNQLGAPVWQQSGVQGDHCIDLGKQAKGSYLLQISDERGNLQYSTKLTLQ